MQVFLKTAVFCSPRNQRARPIIIDPALYSLQKSDVFWATEKRSVPTAFKLFTGKGFDLFWI